MAIQQPQHTSHPPQSRSRLLSWVLSPKIVPNEGSTARDHLTRDRTWMQWIRMSSLLVVVSLVTCISFPGHSDDDNHHNESHLERLQSPFAIAFMVLSILLPLVGLFEYLTVHRSMSMKRGIAQSGFFSGFMITATCLVLISFTFVLYHQQSVQSSPS